MKFDDQSLTRLQFLTQMAIPKERYPEELMTLNRMGQVIETIKEVDTEGVIPMANPHDATLTLREDRVTEDNNRETYQKLTQNTSDGLYIVPQVIE